MSQTTPNSTVLKLQNLEIKHNSIENNHQQRLILYFERIPKNLTLSDTLPNSCHPRFVRFAQRHGSTSLFRQPWGCCTQPPLGTSKHRLCGTAPAARFTLGTSPAADGSTYGSSSDVLAQDVSRVFILQGLVKADLCSNSHCSIHWMIYSMP